MKAIQLLPGVHAGNEGSTGFSVRGGNPDQNLVLLDNTTVYNASHLMGFFPYSITMSLVTWSFTKEIFR